MVTRLLLFKREDWKATPTFSLIQYLFYYYKSHNTAFLFALCVKVLGIHVLHEMSHVAAMLVYRNNKTFLLSGMSFHFYSNYFSVLHQHGNLIPRARARFRPAAATLPRALG